MKSINWRYAVGELLIVILGISIAFSLNNWKENRANQRQRAQYIAALRLDVASEIEQLESLVAMMEDRTEVLRVMSYALLNPIPGRDSILGRLFEVANAPSFRAENITYQTLVNSGDLKLIDDFELRRAIEAHYAGHELVRRNFARLDNIYAEHLGTYFVERIDYGAVRQGDFSSIENEYFRNILYSMMGSYQWAGQALVSCLDSNRSLLAQLPAENVD